MRFLLIAAFLLPALAQEPATEPPKPRRPMPEPKNLKVLKMPAAELIPTMRAYSASLGVQCVFCHVQGNFASDDNPKKDVARKMITMAEHINASGFGDGKVHVTCYTCHRGEAEPKSVVPMPPPGERDRPRPPQ